MIANEERVFKMLQAGDLHLAEVVQEGFMMMGMTKRGKTSLGHHLCGNPLKGFKDNGIKLITTTQNDSNAKIGLSFNSETEIPNIFRPTIKEKEGKQTKQTKFVVIDCPGWVDSYGYRRIITNGYFNYRVFSKVQKAKFIVVFQRNDIGSSCSNFISTVKIFLQNFKDYKAIKNEIMNSTVFVFTKCNETPKEIITILNKLLENFESAIIQKSMLQDFIGIIKNMMQNDKIFTIKQAEDNVFLPPNTLIKDINSKTTFWKRQAKDNLVDMTEINFSILKQIDNKRSDEECINGLKMLMKSFEERVLDVLKMGITAIFKQIMNDTFADSDSNQFFKKMNEFQIQRYKFFLQEEEKKRKIVKEGLFYPQRVMGTSSKIQNSQPSLYWLKKMNVSQAIFNQVFQFSDQIMKRDIDTIINISEKFMRLIKKVTNIVKNTTENRNIVNNYGYLIYRMFEEAKIFFLLFSDNINAHKQGSTIQMFDQFFDFHHPMKEAISALFQERFKDKKQVYGLKYQIINGLTLINYQEILVFFKSIQPSNEQNKKILRAKEALIILQMSNLDNDNNGGDSNGNSSSKKLKIIKDLNEIRQQLYIDLREDFDKPNLKQQKLFTLFKTMNKLGQYLFTIECYQLSIKCFDSVFNISKALQIYQKKIDKQKNIQQKRKYLLMMSQYASNNLRFDIAVTKLQQAYALSNNYQQLYQTSDLLFKCGTNLTLLSDTDKNLPFTNYVKSMMHIQVYKELSTQDCKDMETIANSSEIGIQKSLK